MKTVVITGGTDGIGKGLALHYLQHGDRVIVIGNSAQKTLALKQEAGDASDRFTFLQADLSLVSENKRVVAELKTITDYIDLLFLCAYKFNQQRHTTKEGLEFMFALHYLSRYILSFGLKPLLAKASNPMVINVSGAGMNGKVKWDDLQSKKEYRAFKVTLQNSQLNDLLGATFAQQTSGIKYILFNPVFVKTSGLINGYRQPVVKLIVQTAAALFAKSIQQTVSVLLKIIANLPKKPLVIYKQQKEVQLTSKATAQSQKLVEATENILTNLKP